MLKYYNYDIVFQEIPNEVTLAINITNCPNRCKGCHIPRLQDNTGEELNEKIITTLLGKYASAITCFCFMGGDAEPYRIVELGNYISCLYPRIKLAWYSGCDVLPEGFDKTVFQYIKLGGYNEKTGSLKCETTNQHLFEVQKDGKMKDLNYLFKNGS
jgi:anaerobic ribonucleoside-triphosphate reductase activating protein